MGLKEVGLSLSHKWRSLNYYGTATDGAIILENKSVFPMEVLRQDTQAGTLTGSNVALHGPGGAVYKTMGAWESIDATVVPTGTVSDKPAALNIIGSESLVSNSGTVGTRIVLMPGSSMRETGNGFAPTDLFEILYREMQSQEVV